MSVPRRPRRVVVDAPAKLNLGLAVGRRRADGFHDIATLFQTISLHDTLIAERTRRAGLALRVRFEDVALRGGRPPRRGDVPRGSDNLVLRAARALALRYGGAGGARLTLVKRIPAGAGLGGGSADAAATLRALTKLWNLRIPPGELAGIAAELGSDVPFALRGGTALGLGRGERLRSHALSGRFRAIVAVPDWRVRTALAFQRIDRLNYGLTRSAGELRFLQHIGPERTSYERAVQFGNTFEQVLGSRRATFESLTQRLCAAGFEHPHLTGSGSAVFAGVRPAARVGRAVQRFVGDEALFLVSSVQSGPRCRQG